MNAKDLLAYFIDMSPWVNPNDTVDKVIVGDPKKKLNKILVTWQSSTKAIVYAIEGGYDALITHEPTFYTHENECIFIESLPDSSATKITALKKLKLTQDAGLIIIRIHDIWDRFPKYGIPTAWAKQLELCDYPSVSTSDEFQYMYTIPPTTVYNFAKHIARKTGASTCEVQIFGDKNREVTKVGIGTGCICYIDVFAKMGCELYVMCDDGASFWSEISLANDMDVPVIRVFHATSEENGIKSLAEYMQLHFKDIQTDFYPSDTNVSFL